MLLRFYQLYSLIWCLSPLEPWACPEVRIPNSIPCMSSLWLCSLADTYFYSRFIISILLAPWPPEPPPVLPPDCIFWYSKKFWYMLISKSVANSKYLLSHSYGFELCSTCLAESTTCYCGWWPFEWELNIYNYCVELNFLFFNTNIYFQQ